MLPIIIYFYINIIKNFYTFSREIFFVERVLIREFFFSIDTLQYLRFYSVEENFSQFSSIFKKNLVRNK